MTITRADLRGMLRQDLALWPVEASLQGAIDAKTDTIKLSDDLYKNYVEGKSILEIDNEILRVVDLPEENESFRVLRGYMGTVKATHLDQAKVNVLPSWGWSDFELNNRILPQAIRFLHPFAWVDIVTAPFYWAGQQQETEAPAGISYPDLDLPYRMENLDMDGVWKPMLGWHLYGTTFKFNRKASETHTLRARILHFQSVLTDDKTPMDDDRFAEAIVKYSVHLCLNALKANRVRYYEYAAALNDRASTPDELIRTAFDFKNQAIVQREEKGMPKPATFASTYREYGT